MINFYQKIKLSLVLVGVMFCYISFGQKTEVINLKSQNRSHIDLSVKLKDFKFKTVDTKFGAYQLIESDFGSALLKKGAPDLLKLSATLQVPVNSLVDVEIIDAVYEDMNNVLIAPSKGNLLRNVDPDKVPYTFGKEYKKDMFFPGKLTSVNNKFVFRSKTGQTIWVYPFQYNPVEKKLRVYKEMTLRVTYKDDSGFATKSDIGNVKDTKVFNMLYDELFINNTNNSRYTSVDDDGKLLVITYPAFEDEMQPFVDWKNQRGQETEMVTYTTAGGSSSALKTYIANRYNNDGITYVLLVGDAGQIPPTYKNGDSDNAYGHITGNDSYPEVIMGRFCGETEAQITTMVNRTIAYEKDLNTTDTWLNKFTGIASGDGGSWADDGETDIQHMNNISTDFTNYGTTVTKIYYPSANSTTVKNTVNTGNGMMAYVGHGSNTYWVTSYFSTSHIAGLTNYGKWPFIFDVACVNGNFKNYECFAEKWIKVSKNNQPTGAVAIIASTINQSWSPPMDGQDEMVDLTVKTISATARKTFGGVTMNGCMHMNQEYGSAGNRMTDTWTIFGDPTVILRTKVPVQPTVSHAITIGQTAGYYNVSCSVNGALAVLYSNGAIVGKKYVTNGSASIQVTGNISGSVKLTITGQDMVTYTANLSVTSSSSRQIDELNFRSEQAGKELMSDDIKVEITPNPASDNLDIIVSDISRGGDITLVNSNGVVVRKTKLNANRSNMSVSGLSSGIYFVKINTNNKVITKRVVVK
ncbi:MAG: C25 family cysteine peptidase [Bacteroidales bacterium]|jgi:hypothetical protein|nr:C25 family cysteine peptidase [Bacteroidales bacterium]